MLLGEHVSRSHAIIRAMQKTLEYQWFSSHTPRSLR
jgi:hypothetical protein